MSCIEKLAHTCGSSVKPLPTLEYLNECFDYSRETGVLTWKERPVNHFRNEAVSNTVNKKMAGKDAGSVNKFGYKVVIIQQVSYRVHRVCYYLATGFDPMCLSVDHKNGDVLDNRADNLRTATQSVQSINKGLQSNNTSGYRGVYFNKKSGKWVAQIKEGEGRTTLGRFTYKEDAIMCRKNAEIKQGHTEIRKERLS